MFLLLVLKILIGQNRIIVRCFVGQMRSVALLGAVQVVLVDEACLADVLAGQLRRLLNPCGALAGRPGHLLEQLLFV